MTAVVKRATRNKSCRGRPGRPKKDGIRKKSKKPVNFNGLDLLHAQTVLSISNSAGVRTEAAPGCVDQTLDSIMKFDSNSCDVNFYKTSLEKESSCKESTDLKTCAKENVQFLNESHSSSISTVPSDTSSPSSLSSLDSFTSINPPPENHIKHQPDPNFMKSVSSALDTFLEGVKQQYMSYIAYLQTPNSKLFLEQQIHDEKKRNALLSAQIDILERTVNSLIQRGIQSLKCRLGELDIVASNSDELVNKAKEIVVRNKELQEQVSSFQEQVNYLDNLNAILKKNKSVEALLSMVNPQKSNVKENNHDQNDKLSAQPNNANSYNNNDVRYNFDSNHADKRVGRIEMRLDASKNSVQDEHPVVNPVSQLCNNSMNVNTTNADNRVNDVLETNRQMDIEERVNSMIVAALNGKPSLPNPTNDEKLCKKDSRTKSLPKIDPPPKPNKFFHRANRDRSSTGVRLTKGSQHASIVAKINKPHESDNQSPGESRDQQSTTVKDKYAWSPHHDLKSDQKASLSSPKVTSVNCSVNNSAPSEDKKPILLTFKLDRRKNGAIVTSPAHPPDKSPANKSPRDEFGVKRKNSSPENGKKSRLVHNGIVKNILIF